jgi:periplasmic divalent cation tolerance protein
MTDMLMVYITCESVEQAKKIGKHLLKKRVCACVNIFPEMHPMFFWPPKSGIIDESKEVVLIVKTIESRFKSLEKEVKAIHPDDIPCIIALPVSHVSKNYYDWLVGEF